MSKRSKRRKKLKRNPIEYLTPYEHAGWWKHYGIYAWRRYDRLLTYGMRIECPVTKRFYAYTREEMKFLMIKIGGGMEPKLAVRTSTFAKKPIE